MNVDVHGSVGYYAGMHQQGIVTVQGSAGQGGEFSAAFLKQKHQEWNDFASHFTQWERGNVLDV